ncbi:MAG: 50S ribosomal protein L13 [Candidatus Omnitrophica bacterium]|nr:50S ribosomal protein L13 [Candidatus Omnitrophota bacterium]
MKTQKTPVPDSKTKIEKKFYVVDATGKTLGRLASNIARILLGKHKSVWVPYEDIGDFVIVTNAAKIRVTGKKLTDKAYYRHSGYLGGLKKETFMSLIQKSPETIIEHAVKGMLPHNRLGRKLLKKLKVYRGSDHPHRAQKPIKLEIE